MNTYVWLQKILFQLPAEQAHNLTLAMLRRYPFLVPDIEAKFENQSTSAIHLWGLNFRNAIGLAAGMDKNAECLSAWKRLGFGFVEIGTVTPLPQKGNPKPRLFRLKKDAALINRMGFNNLGMEAVARNLQNSPKGLIIGANIGKNKDTPNDDALSDYSKCLQTLQPYCDYITVNISSPNTPGLRELQKEEIITRLLSDIQNINQKLSHPKPLLVKVAPDIAVSEVSGIAQAIRKARFVGVIATNTTISREGLHLSNEEIQRMGAGGLSGKPLTQMSLDIARLFVSEGIDVVAVGGIMQPSDAVARLAMGAKLIQTYTGFVYGGPYWLAEMIQEIQKKP